MYGVVGCIIAAASAGIVVLGVRYAGAHRAGRIDAALDARVRHHLGGHLDFLHFLVSLADPASVIAACAALAFLFFFTGRRRAALLAVLGPPVAAGFTEFVLKPLIDRRLADSLSFPSGHTTAAVSVAMVVVVALLGPSRPSWPPFARWGLSALALLSAAAVATALVGSGYHYATDTVGGFCVAAASVLAVAWIIDLLAHRRHDDSGPYEGKNREFTRTR
jgi:undecaprenyl-diphosphatase